MNCVARLLGAGVLVSAFSGLLGCAADRVSGVNFSPSTAVGGMAHAGVLPSCQFSVRSINDQREHSSLGVVVFTRVDGEGFVQWFTQGISSIPGYSKDPARIDIGISLLKAHMISLSTYKSANIIVKVDPTVEGQLSSSKVYRGRDGSINWASSESEVQAAFNSAMNDLKQQIAEDISKQCKAV